MVPQLIERGHEVTATTRRVEGVAVLRDLGAEADVVDGLDGVALGEAVARADPEVIVHQMTALSSVRRWQRSAFCGAAAVAPRASCASAPGGRL
jgi:nucleoside-diphosphate-sugar epimerase